MLKEIMTSRVYRLLAVLTAIFAVVLLLFPPCYVIDVLNGAFLGSFVAGVVLYHELIIQAASVSNTFNRVRVMVIGMIGWWIARAMGSFYLTIYPITDVSPPHSNAYFVAVILYLIVISSCLQISAPSFDPEYKRNGERKLLFMGVVAGAIVALIVIFIQVKVTGV